MPFFWLRGKENLHKKIDQLNQQIENLKQHIEFLTKARRLSPIRIEQLTIHNPKLESLIFRLDALDVEEISGSLNLGNNFGAKVNQQERTKKVKKSQAQATATGYRFYLNDSQK